MGKWAEIPTHTGAEISVRAYDGWVEIEAEQEALSDYEGGDWVSVYAALTPAQARYLSRMLDVCADIAREENG